MRILGLRLTCVLLVISNGCASAPVKPPAKPPLFVDPTIAAAHSDPGELVQLLSSPEASTRAAAAWALAGAKEAQPDLRTALEPLRSDGDRSVRYAVIWALAHLQDPHVSPGPPPDETPPKVKRQCRPTYPQDAFRAGIYGTVVVEVLIGEQGEVAHAEIRESRFNSVYGSVAPQPELYRAALESVWCSEFEPARIRGLPQAEVVHVPVGFRIY
jgi:TonB family protein